MATSSQSSESRTSLSLDGPQSHVPGSSVGASLPLFLPGKCLCLFPSITSPPKTVFAVCFPAPGTLQGTWLALPSACRELCGLCLCWFPYLLSPTIGCPEQGPPLCPLFPTPGTSQSSGMGTDRSHGKSVKADSLSFAKLFVSQL